MAQIPLSKAQLAREKENLAAFDRYLPALDLKRQQLMNARNEVRQRVAGLGERLAALTAAVGDELPMLADRRIDLDGLVRLRAVRERTVNVAGVRMPALDGIEVEIAPYGRMVRPHWVDAVVGRLEEALRLRLEVAVAQRQVAILNRAAARVTQRVNLFEKILKPEAKANIRKIMLHLGDAERAAVVAAKIAKRQRAAEAAALAGEGGTA